MMADSPMTGRLSRRLLSTFLISMIMPATATTTTTTVATSRRQPSPSFLARVAPAGVDPHHQHGGNVDGNVKCGSHYATMCSECPQGHGAEWCNVDCHWDEHMGCVSVDLSRRALAATTTTTTTGHPPSHHEDTRYVVMSDHECGGREIYTWAAGGPSGHGSGYHNDIMGCKLTCALHNDCAGFTVRGSDQECSLWAGGKLSLQPSPGNACYEKSSFCPDPPACPVCPACPELMAGQTTTLCPTTTYKDTSVKCGSHYARDCQSCPQGHGAEWCNADCMWDDGLGCLSRESDVLDMAKTTTTTTGARRDQASYGVLRGHHCGGSTISVWAGGGDSGWGTGFANNIEGCQLTCRLHPDCAGFMFRESDSQCSLWVGGTLSPYTSAGYDCYRKVFSDGFSCPEPPPCPVCPACAQTSPCGLPSDEKVIQQFTVANVDYMALIASPGMTLSFKSACASSLAAAAGVNPASVLVTFAAGSVRVRAEITPSDGRTLDEMEGSLEASASLGAVLVQAILDNVAGIHGISSGAIAVAGFTTAIEEVVLTHHAPCSVTDGSWTSSVYPCQCGKQSCVTEEVCNISASSPTSICLGVAGLIKESDSIRLQEQTLEELLRTTHRQMNGLQNVVNRLAGNITDAMNMEADAGETIAREATAAEQEFGTMGGGEGTLWRGIGKGKDTGKMQKLDVEAEKFEKGVQKTEQMATTKIEEAKKLVGNATLFTLLMKSRVWAYDLARNLTLVDGQVNAGARDVKTYEHDVATAVNRSIDTMMPDMVASINARQSTFLTYSKKVISDIWRQRVLARVSDASGGGAAVPPRVSSRRPATQGGGWRGLDSSREAFGVSGVLDCENCWD